LTAVNLMETLSYPYDTFTLFAPTDAAFIALPEGLVDCLLAPSNRVVLTNVMALHIVPERLLASDLSDETRVSNVVSTLMRKGVGIDIARRGEIRIDGISIITPDILASNGVIHTLDDILLPNDFDVQYFLRSCATPTLAPITDPPITDPPVASDTSSFITSAPVTSPPVTITSAPVTLAPVTSAPITPIGFCPDVPEGGCSICGPGKCVGNSDAIFMFPGQPEIQCDVLQQAGLGGIIPINDCNFLPSLVKKMCACAPEV